ncbi:MAG: TonB-dependent receptor [Bacteroidota bacterium]
MRFHFFLSLFFLFGLNQIVYAQSGKLSGIVYLDNELAVGATVQIKALNSGTVTGVDGKFLIKKLPYGTHDLEISFVGAAPFKQTVELNQPELDLRVDLSANAELLNDITISAQSQSAELNNSPITISSLDAKAIQDQDVGAEELLKRSSGVVVRQQGGLGSATTINLNGLTGNAVRVYYDGIPLQVFGGGIQLNNIPVDALERVDVYKGVMPITIGTDALGGGINLVPLRSFEDYLRTSYTFGSFNTHRFTLSGRKNISDKFSISTISYVNYSDNDYKMRDVLALEEVTQENGLVVVEEVLRDVDRFHNSHFSGFLELEAALRDLTWADQLRISASGSFRSDEIQHGQVIQNTSVGEVESAFRSVNARLDYKKRLLNDKLSLRYFGTFSYTVQDTRDTSSLVFGWDGLPFQTRQNPSGSELFSFATLRTGMNTGTAHRLFVDYQLTSNLSFAVSNFYRFSNIEGNDPVGPRFNINGEEFDPNTIPAKLGRNIFGAELTGKWFQERLTTIAFYKNYIYNAESIDITQRDATVIPVRNVNDTQNGYGVALKFKVSEAFSIRGSYERATRIPTESEIFGNFAAILPNYTLRPEISDNINAGFTLEPKLKKMFLKFQVDGFIRNQQDLIRLDDFGPENAVFVNEASVDGLGFEVTTVFKPVRTFTLTGAFTLQSTEITSDQLGVGSQAGSQVPNIPRLFFNVGANYGIDKLFSEKDKLSLFWNYFYVDRFSINEVEDLDTANPVFVIPSQHLHNAGFTYSPKQDGFSFTVTVRNVFNNQIFDNFRIPRPGINYSLKVTYTL